MIKKTAEEWYERSRSVYINQNSKLPDAKIEFLPCGRDRTLGIIRGIMEDHEIIKAGWISTSIRGIHENLIFYR